jgi:hypothetical protein
MTTENIKQLSLEALPILVRSARQRKILSYQELTDKLGKHPHIAAHILRCIRDEICIPRGLPYISAIVGHKNTLIPGDGFLPEGTAHLTPEEKKQKYEELRDEVFAFKGWEDVLVDLGLAQAPVTPEELDEEGRQYNEMMERTGGGGGEDELHRLLKEYIANHPERLGLLKARPGQMEYKFISGDVGDVVFELDNRSVVAEIKNGVRGEQVKGIYQAIKYRALLTAEKGKGSPYLVSAWLVAYGIPEDIEDFARLFDVRCLTVPINSF